MIKTNERTSEMTLFGKKLMVKNYTCSGGGHSYEKKDPVKIQLSIIPTFFCPAHCPFCVAMRNTGRKGFLNTKKLEKALVGLRNADALRGISITGGEPFTDVKLLNEIVEMIFDIFGIEMEVCINTNGSGLKHLQEIKRYPLIDTIHMSRHHYDDSKNRACFRTLVPTGSELAEIIASLYDRRLLVFNCLLLKDGIGTKEEMYKYLEFAADIGASKVGFVTAMPINEYAKKNVVSYAGLFDRKDPRLLFTNAYCDYEFCHCQDAVYAAKNGRLVELYGRETAYGCGRYVRGLVYGADNVLRTGFSEEAEVVAAF